jgi:hypothetical protein
MTIDRTKIAHDLIKKHLTDADSLPDELPAEVRGVCTFRVGVASYGRANELGKICAEALRSVGRCRYNAVGTNSESPWTLEVEVAVGGVRAL